MRLVLRSLGAGLSGAALALCFVPFNQSWIVWGWLWLLLPLLWTTRGKRPALRGFGLAFIAGFAFWLVNLKWLGTVTGLGVAALAAYLAIYFGLFGAFAAKAGNPWLGERAKLNSIRDRFRQMWRSLGYAVALGGFWCGLEWIRGWMLTGFGWNGLGVSFANNLVLAQHAEFVGVIGLSFLPVFFSAVAVQTAHRFYQQFRAGEVKMLHWDFASALLVIMLSFTIGLVRMQQVQNAEKIPMRVVLIQQNIPQIAGRVMWEPHEIVDGFVDLTEKSLKEIEDEAIKSLDETEESEVLEIDWPDMVIWPEACLPEWFKIRENKDPKGGPAIEGVVDYIVGLGDFALIFGANEYSGDDPMNPDVAVFNSMLVDRKGNERQSYQKHHLVYFGEALPPGQIWRDLYKDATGGVEFGSGITAGTSMEPLSFELDGREIGIIPSICFEDTVPRLTRKFVRDEPQVLVNITNDGWFGESEGAAQHFQNSIFRAIELRRPMVRSANRGMTTVVSAIGSTIDHRTGKDQRLVDENGSHFHRGSLLASAYLPADGGVTLYARFGDWFAVTGLTVGLGWWIYAGFLLRRKKW